MSTFARQRILFALTSLWSVDHLVGWFVHEWYGIGITGVASLILLVSLAGIASQRFSGLGHNLLALLFFVATLGPSQSTMTVAFLIAVVLSGTTRDGAIPWAGAYTAAGVYFFAGMNKLISEDWRDGRIVDFSALSDWNLVPTAIYGTVVFELLLALLLIMRMRISILAIVIFHTGIIAMVPSTIHHAFSLGVYGGIMVFMAYWACPVTIRQLWLFLRGRRRIPRPADTAAV